ncbi:MAG TPA: PAS domain S-box protein [Anaerolineales bacterium]|nr:PAS domain S-box protein [Anaerolineales bacterium]
MTSTPPLRVLFLNHHPEEVESQVGLLRAVAPDLQYDMATSEAEFRRALGAGPHLILSAFHVNGFHASHALRMLRLEGRLSPFIVVACQPDEAEAADCLREGAVACVAPDQLVEVVRRHVFLPPAPGAALADRVEGLAEILHHTMEGIVIEDADGRLTFVNPAAAGMLGYAQEELIGRHWTLLIPEDQQAVVRAADARREAGRSDRYELELLHRDGTRIPVLVSGSPRFVAGDFRGSLAVFTEIASIKRTEEALRSTNATLRALIEASPLAITVWEGDGTVRLWNSAAEKMFGWTEPEVLGRFPPIVPAERREEHRHLRERTLRGEQVDNVVVALRRKDGAPIDISLSTAPVRNAAGEVTGVLGIMADITRRRQTEAALRESEEKFRSLAEESPNMIFINQAGRVVYANPQAAEVMGYTRDEMLDPDFDFLKLVAPESRPTVLENFERHRLGEDVPPQAYALVTRDRRRLEAIHTTRLIRYKGSNAILGVITDITERRQAEAALRESEERYRALTENAPVGIYRTTPDGRILFVNPAGLRMLGFESIEEMAQRNLETEGFDPGYPRRAFKERLEREGEIIGMESAWRRRDGTTIFVRENARVVRDDGGRVQYYEGTVEDITQRKRAEDAVAQRARQLQALYETSLEISSQHDSQGVLQAIVRRTAESLEVSSGGLYLVLPDNETLELAVGHGMLPEFIGTRLKRGEGASGRVLESGESLMVEDYAAWPARSSRYPAQAFRRVLCVPLKTGGRVIGVLVAADDRSPGAFGLDEIRLAESLGDQAAIAIENARLLESERRRAQELQALYETSIETIRQADLDGMLRTMVERASRLVGSNKGGLYLVDPDGESLTLVVSHNYNRDYTGAKLRMGEGVSGRVAETGQVMILDDYQTYEPKAQAFRDIETRRLMAVPLKVGDRVAGVLNVADDEPGGFDDQAVRLVHLFADQAALAMENARLLEAERQRAAELARAHGVLFGLSRVAGRLERTHDPEQVLTTLRDQLLPFGVNFWMASLDSATGDLVVRFATPEAGLLAPLEKALGLSVRGYRIPPERLPFYERLILQREPQLVDSASLLHALVPDMPQPMIDRVSRVLGIGPETPTMCLPLASEAGVLGGIFLWGGALTAADIDTYTVFASQVAAALEQARLLEMERQRSRALAHSHGVLSALSQVAANLEGTRDPDEFFQTLGVELRRIQLGCWLAIVDHPSESFTIRYTSLTPDVVEQVEKVIGSRLVGRSIPASRIPVYGQLVRERRAVLTKALEAARQIAPRLPRRALNILAQLAGITPETRLIGLPLVARDLVTGVLFIWGEALEESDMEMYAAFSSQVAVALEKARLIDDMTQHATFLGAVVKVAGALRGAISRGDMLPIILEQLRDLLEAEGVACEMLMPSQAEARVELALGVWKGWTGRLRSVVDGVRAQVLRMHQPYLTANAPADSLFHRRDDLAGARAVAVVPLVSQEQVVGGMWIGRRTPFTESEERIMVAVADMAANAMHRAGVMEELEERVQERTRALEEANDQLTALDQLKTEFVSNVSHELRTPIANILLYLELLNDAAREARRGEYQGILKREAERLARLIEDLLTLSRMERGMLQLNFEAHALDPILGEVVAAQRPRAEAKGIRLVHEPDLEVPAAWVSREQLVQVFTNLIGNAVAYTPSKGTVIVSTRAARFQDRLHVIARVHNSGPPIPAEDLPHIFERFYRGRTARHSGEPGTGLGLAISKDIVERHHGWIEVESNASVGTTFSVWLPVSPP